MRQTYRGTIFAYLDDALIGGLASLSREDQADRRPVASVCPIGAPDFAVTSRIDFRAMRLLATLAAPALPGADPAPSSRAAVFESIACCALAGSVIFFCCARDSYPAVTNTTPQWRPGQRG